MEIPETHTDGNGAAGLLQEVFAVEITTARRVCDGCGEEHPIGAHRAFDGAGMVLRCPGCDALAAAVTVTSGEYVIGLHGAWRLAKVDQ